jgi:ElaB/YqjD/DUF883 family membrane-anchored ribosome-binding protein
MGQSQSTSRAPLNETQELHAEIERTRQELGDTVAELAARTDIKARAHEKLEHTKAAVTAKREQLVSSTPGGARSAAAVGAEKVRQNPVLAAAVGAFVIGLLIGRVSAR